MHGRDVLRLSSFPGKINQRLQMRLREIDPYARGRPTVSVRDIDGSRALRNVEHASLQSRDQDR